ncbi:hypothetical protein KAR91_78080 [Candidatus Pacearchaeota archaeon]|nr:hypothetical protein [Candidatus Pacearchaeota archaeon]
MSFRYKEKMVSYYVKKAHEKILLIHKNNIGTRDSHQQMINKQIVDLCLFLTNRLACAAANIYLPEGVEFK